MNWVEHLELLEESMVALGDIGAQRFPMPDSLVEVFCLSEGVIGNLWEDRP